MNNKDKQYIINNLTSNTLNNNPFPHIVIDNFLPDHIAKILANEFPSYDSDTWFNYSNRLKLNNNNHTNVLNRRN